MEVVITNRATDSSQTEISGEGGWDLWRYRVLPTPHNHLCFACAISVSKCSSFIYYSPCSTPLFLFLFSHTPFSLSSLGGAVFIFGVFILLSSWHQHLSLAALHVGDFQITWLSRGGAAATNYVCFSSSLTFFIIFYFLVLGRGGGDFGTRQVLTN